MAKIQVVYYRITTRKLHLRVETVLLQNSKTELLLLTDFTLKIKMVSFISWDAIFLKKRQRGFNDHIAHCSQ